MAHPLENFGSGGGAADVPVLDFRVGADDEEVGGGIDAAVYGAGGEYDDVACVDSDGLAALSAEDEVGLAGGEAQDFVCGGVVMMEVVDAVAPLWRPAIGGEEALHRVREIGPDRKGVAIEERQPDLVFTDQYSMNTSKV